MFLHCLFLMSLNCFFCFFFALNLVLKLVINLFLVPLAFVLETLAPTHLHNPSQSLVFDFARNVPIKLKHYVICKSVAPFQPAAVNVNIAPVSVRQHVNVVKSVFCHPHVSFLAKPLLTTVNLDRPVTVCNVKSVNSAHYIRRMFPSVHCNTSIHRPFSYRRYENVTSFPLPPLNLISSPSITFSIRSFTKTFISSWNLISSKLSTCVFIN